MTKQRTLVATVNVLIMMALVTLYSQGWGNIYVYAGLAMLAVVFGGVAVAQAVDLSDKDANAR
ncbi:hypothetical protein ACLI1L_000046 [Corynebacterium sp. LaCa117]|uniref:hypothetical protein n=1 Tax=unclassified Corynebacterium TaxID=2624378 RepID=UPI001EF32B77|nr:hypothetical protein [Corynebacterium sp. ACRPF]MCG7461948.1 hypothetical protein [Corynebacterium sp. ACRPF]MDV2418087.1 hypothetical protein [Corynebacterium tuberculostearicum]